MTHESKIQDYLANHLNCLEEGLSLIQKEFPLSNPLGASGRIDILARDKYGQHVLIEIKRSNQASRQALHELHKYVALYQTNMGISVSEIRCIVVSTTWHELLVPFSEYFRSSTHSIVGFEIKTNEDGVILNSKKIDPLKVTEEIKLCPEHIVYLFVNKGPISAAVAQCIQGLSNLKVDDYCILEISYKGTNTNVIYPYGLYVVISAFNESQKIEQASNLEIDSCEFNPDESPFYIEETLLGRLNELVKLNDSCEIGYPEKFTDIRENWSITKIHRSGKLKKNEKIIHDNELLQQIAGFKGQNAFYYQGFSTPRYKEHWVLTINNAKYTLIGNKRWWNTLKWFSQLIESLSINSDVSFQIFNPTNIIGSIYKYYTTDQMSYLPQFEIVVVSEDKSNTYILVGTVTWDGIKINKKVEQVLRPSYLDPEMFFFAIHQGIVYENDESIMERIGINYSQFLLSNPDTNSAGIKYVSINNDRISLKQKDQFSDKTIQEFMSDNSEFISSICNFIETNSVDF